MNHYIKSEIDPKKEKRIEIFTDTLFQIYNNPKLIDYNENSVNKTTFYENDVVLKTELKKENKAIVTILNDRSFSAAKSLKGSVAVLNFASAINIGGGVSRGSNAQEECLCRCSTLYPSLSRKDLWQKYYNAHRKKDNFMYSDRMIYSPEIVVFKTDTALPELEKEADWYKVNIITSAAPNLRDQGKISDVLLYNTFKNRIRKIFNIAIENNNRNIVLGAFGCGAFKNPPSIVASAFKSILAEEEYLYYFDNIIFAVYSVPGKDIENFNIFTKILKNI